MFTLYTTPLSANGRKALAVVKHLRLAPKIVDINVYTGKGQTNEFLAINPFGKIPTLVDDDFILWESNAIIQYISEKFGRFALTSEDVQKRADISRWLFWESSHWQPAISKVVAAVVGHQLIPEMIPKPSSSPNWVDDEFIPLANHLDSHLASGDFLVGETISIADFSVAGMMTYFHFAKFPFDAYPNIEAWYARLEMLDAWHQTEAELWRR